MLTLNSMVESYSLISAGPYYRLDGLIPEVFNYQVEIQKMNSEEKVLYCANLFENRLLFSTVLSSSEQQCAQVAYGPELFAYEKEVIAWLEKGHNLQIWFENPEQYYPIKSFSAPFRSQVDIVYVPNKKFQPQRLIAEVESQDRLSILAKPKFSNIDSTPSIQEFYLFFQKISSQCQVKIVFLPSLFKDFPQAVCDFYQNVNLSTFEKALRRNQAFYFFLYESFKTLKAWNLTSALDYSRIILSTLLMPQPRHIALFLIWPFLKIWWFTSYQWKKRIMRRHEI